MGPTEVLYQYWISEVLISPGSTWTVITSVGDGGSFMLLLHSFPEVTSLTPHFSHSSHIHFSPVMFYTVLVFVASSVEGLLQRLPCGGGRYEVV